MKSIAKSPYEIRADLLQLSFEILLQKHIANGAANASGPTTTSPTTDEVIEEAEKLNKFVSKDHSDR
jgi:hypothetical protein